MIEIKNLSKKYKNNSYFSLKNANFTCNAGEIVGIVGGNGAGKSTLLKCLVGLLDFSEGEILINGYNIKTQNYDAKKQFGYISDDHSVFENMTGYEYVNFMADIFEVPADVRQKRLEALEQTFKLGNNINSLISSYSFGMKQKICIMGVLIYQPNVWILDEPFTGLDASTTYEVEQLMLDYINHKKTVIFSSHDLHIVEKICDRIYIINKGEIVEECEVKNFAQTHKGKSLEQYFIENIAKNEQNN